MRLQQAGTGSSVLKKRTARPTKPRPLSLRRSVPSPPSGIPALGWLEGWAHCRGKARPFLWPWPCHWAQPLVPVLGSWSGLAILSLARSFIFEANTRELGFVMLSRAPCSGIPTTACKSLTLKLLSQRPRKSVPHFHASNPRVIF